MLISELKTLKSVILPHRVYNSGNFKHLKGFSLDSRSIGKNYAFIALKGKYTDGHEFIQEAAQRGASCIIAERFVPTKQKVCFFLVKNSYDVLSSVVAYIRKKRRLFVYAITGSIGKTTTKEILSFLLEPHTSLAKSIKTENNILGLGKTFFALKNEKVLVVELGTNAKGEIGMLARACTPDVGIITHIKPVHLKGLGNLKGVLAEKTSLFKANQKMKLVLNRDDPYLAKIKTKRKVYWFGRDRSDDFFASLVKRENGYSFFLIKGKYPLSLPTYKESFITNYLAAISAAGLFGIPLKKLMQTLHEFQSFPPMRMEMKELNGFTVVNDAYNSNPYSFKEALKGISGCGLKKIAIVADMLELGAKSAYYHRQLAGHILRSGFDYCLTFGQYTLYLEDELKKRGYKKAIHFNSHKDIADFINKKIKLRIGPKKRLLIFLKGSRSMELEKVLNYL